jgi:hypothetical protein
MTEFQTLFPHTHQRIEKLIQPKPHDYVTKDMAQARWKSAKIVGKKIIYLPFQLIFYAGFNVALLVQQVAKLIFFTFQLLTDKSDKMKYRKTALLVVDYTMLLALLPILRVTTLFKMIAACIYPHVHFKAPQACSLGQQHKFYKNQTEKLFNYLYSRFSRDINGFLHSLKNGVHELSKHLKNDQEAKNFFTTTYTTLLDLKKNMSPQKLEAFRQTLVKIAAAKQVAIEIQTPF